MLEGHTVDCVQPAAAVDGGGLPTGCKELPPEDLSHPVGKPPDLKAVASHQHSRGLRPLRVDLGRIVLHGGVVGPHRISIGAQRSGLRRLVSAFGSGGLPTGREELPTQNPSHLVRNPTEGIFPELNRVFSQKT